jgi:NAD(P)-dependent dehydrogenase (short-subunit alcohol dehydrogenase family)
MLGKVVAFDVDCAAALMAERIVRETLIPGGGDEIGYRHGERFFLHPEPAPLDAAPAREDWRPGPGAVVLATGGARGITASICRELAAPGVRLVLVGRAAAATGEERAANLRAFRDAGAEVEYHGLDVGSQVAFGGLIDALYARYGRIDAVLHGAGVIEDQRFAAKTRDSFDRVFDVKADSGFILARHLRPEDLRWVVLFGSVSGRFGNSGQADYAAANETLARIGRWMNARWPATRVVTIQWGPWRGTGMASEDVQRLLGSQGIVPIEPASGRRFFVDELRRGGKADAEVIAGQGPWSMPPDQDLGSVFASLMPLLHPRGSVEPEDAPGPPAAMPPPSARPLAVLP